MLRLRILKHRVERRPDVWWRVMGEIVLGSGSHAIRYARQCGNYLR